MFSSNITTGFNQDAIQKSQLDNNLNVPSKTDSVFEGLGRSFAEPWLGLADVDAAMTRQPGENEGAHILLNNLAAQGSQNPISFDIGSLAGFALNPVNLVSGGLGGEAGGLLADAATGFAPDVIQKAASSVIGGGLGMEASMLPSDIADNANPDTNSIDWGGVAKAMPANLGIGMTFGLGHFALGLGLDALQARRIAKGQAAQQAATSQEITDAFNDGTIDQDQHDFMQAYNSGADQETLNTLASKVASKNGVQSPEVNVSLLKPEDLSNLQVIAGDELGADVPLELKGAISNYIVNKNIDDIRSNPVAMTTLKGFSEHMDTRLAGKDAELNSIDNNLEANANKAQNLKSSIDQKTLYQEAKDNNGQLIGKTMPKEVQARLDNESRTKELQSEIKGHNQELREINNYLPTAISEKRIIAANQRINNLKATVESKTTLINTLKENKPKLLKVRDELNAIRQRILKKGIDENTLANPDFKRLTELHNDIKEPASKSILTRIVKELQYNRQAAIKTVADKILSLNENSIPKQAYAGKLFDYLKARIETKTELAKANEAPKHITPENVKAQLETAQKENPDMAKEAQNYIGRADTFKANQAKFTDLIFCLENSENV